jgi:hypothetical protein
MPNITPESSSGPNNPEGSENELSAEQQAIVLKDWFDSVSKIDYLVRSKKREYVTENIDAFIRGEIDELSQILQPQDSELLKKLQKVREVQEKVPHRNDILTGKCIAIDDKDKVVLIYLWNEEQAYGAKANMDEVRLEIEFLYKTPVDMVDKSRKISYALVTDNKLNPVSIFTQDQHQSSLAENAKEITETLKELASDPDLDERSLTLSEASKLTPPTGPIN